MSPTDTKSAPVLPLPLVDSSNDRPRTSMRTSPRDAPGTPEREVASTDPGHTPKRLVAVWAWAAAVVTADTRTAIHARTLILGTS